jgi:cytochrome c oxidase subunit 2
LAIAREDEALSIRGWFPENISTYGGDLDSVFFLIYYIVGFWFIVTEVAIFVFIFRYRRGRQKRAVFLRGETPRELAWILVPAVVVLALDLGIDAAGARVWDKVKTEIPAGDVRLEVTAKQFEWLIKYPGVDGMLGTEDDFTLDTELHVPAGKDIRIRLRSEDVLHSFFLPNVRLKQDVVPGREIDVWFNAVKPGTYELACAELCGLGHYTMRGVLIVHPPDEFERWVREQGPQA